MEIGSKVFVHPQHSIRYRGRWGEVLSKVVDDTSGITFFRVSFKTGSSGYLFRRKELLSYKDYASILRTCKGGVATVVIHGGNREVKVIDGIKPFSAHHFVCPSTNEKYLTRNLYPVMRCSHCNKDNTGEFSAICEDCLLYQDLLGE